MGFSIEVVLLVISILFFLSILAGKAGYRFGVPALLLFLSVGMLFGSDGFGIQFQNIQIAQIIGTVALCIILFSGGMDTKFADIRPVIAQGIVLATLGVFLTAMLTGVIIWWLLESTVPGAAIGLTTALLLASTMSSTDSASVFSILRSRGLRLKNNLRPMLELESGSNDPMAYILTITFIELIKMGAEPDYASAIGLLLMQMVIGAVAGYALGKLSVYLINKLHIDNASVYPIMVLTFCIFIFSATYFLKGNGYLAVYIGGLVIGNSRFIHKRSALNFFDGMAWMSQLLMFLTLGLLVNPRELVDVALPGLVISFLMIFITRPISVFISLLPFNKMAVKDKIFVSWVGLRGAVPIIFAIIPLAENVPHAQLMFNIVFFCTLVSLVLQGTSLSRMAMWLGLVDKPSGLKKAKDFEIEFSDDIQSHTTEITIRKQALAKGDRLMNLALPDNMLAVMVKRGPRYFVPSGDTVLKENDKLLLLTDDEEALKKTVVEHGAIDVVA